MPLNQGQVLQERYRIVEAIGQGGFGAVYRAWDLNLKRPCAVKENLDTSEDAQRQFQREATTLARLNHPNLPRVYDHFIIPEQGQYLVMDFVQGDSLRELLEQRGRVFTHEEALPWIRQVCQALAYLHHQAPPIIHRDVKPDNILITPQGQAMLVDFGIVKIYNPDAMTTSGARAVTPGFSPPEQYGFGKTDARADVYAIGATLYMLLTGQRPPESVDILADKAELMPPSRINPAVMPELEQAILVAMAVSTSKRFPDAAAFLEALPQLNDRDAAAPPPIHHLSLPLWAMGAVVALLIAVSAFIFWPRTDNTPEPTASPTDVALVLVTATATLAPAATATPDKNVDIDQDGLTQNQEEQMGTLPDDPDTDGDGLSDGDELLLHNTDPLQRDTDGDLLADGDEISQYQTNPLNADSDGDGRSDAVELSEGTDPLAVPTATPRPAPTATPTTPPTPACPAVTGTFANVWSQVQDKIGCANGGAISGVVVEESFQSGMMIWREPLDYAQALVLYSNGTWAIYPHAPYVEGDPEYPCADANTPAQSPPTPRRGFGTMWCDIPAIRNGLGNATDVERAFTGTMRAFANGFMIRTDDNTIFVCYDDGTWERR